MFRGKSICVIIAGFLFITVGSSIANQVEDELVEKTDRSEKQIASTDDQPSWDGFKTDLDKTKEPTRLNLIKQFSLAIGFVALLGYGTFYFSKKVIPKLSVSKGKKIVISDSVSLGQNKTLHIIEIENKKLLIGCTSNNINTLAELSVTFQETLETFQEDENEE